jgi:pimeloyl-ACP methyl ester carboxylesterase
MKRALSLAIVLAASSAEAQIPMLAHGKTIDFVFDAKETHHTDEVYEGRIFLPAEVRGDAQTPRPLVVFLHGINVDHTRFRFSGGKPDEPDIRLVLGDLVARRVVPPLVVAAPTTTVSCEVPVATWPSFDLDAFVARTARALRGKVTIDLDRVVLVGHSGGGCNAKGGIFSALAGTTLHLRGVMSIDTCMSVTDARVLAAAPPWTDVVVTWQPFTWKRPFEDYQTTFRETKPPEGSLRALEEFHPEHGNAHNVMVELTLEKYLARVLARPTTRSVDE